MPRVSGLEKAFERPGRKQYSEWLQQEAEGKAALAVLVTAEVSGRWQGEQWECEKLDQVFEKVSLQRKGKWEEGKSADGKLGEGSQYEGFYHELTEKEQVLGGFLASAESW